MMSWRKIFDQPLFPVYLWFLLSGTNLLWSAGFAGIGGLLIRAGKATIKNGLDEDASSIEQLLGAEIMGRTYIVPGAGSVAGGAIAGLIFFGQHERIRSVIRRNYEPAGTLIISPSVMVTSINKSSALGMTVMVKF